MESTLARCPGFEGGSPGSHSHRRIAISRTARSHYVISCPFLESYQHGCNFSRDDRKLSSVGHLKPGNDRQFTSTIESRWETKCLFATNLTSRLSTVSRLSMLDLVGFCPVNFTDHCAIQRSHPRCVSCVRFWRTRSSALKATSGSEEASGAGYFWKPSFGSSMHRAKTFSRSSTSAMHLV
jgi:hypothetical protein